MPGTCLDLHQAERILVRLAALGSFQSHPAGRHSARISRRQFPGVRGPATDAPPGLSTARLERA